MSTISASENNSKEFSLENSKTDVSISNAEYYADNITVENSNDKMLEQSKDEVIHANHTISSKDDSQLTKGIYESTQMECSPHTQHYSSGNIVYNVKIFDIVSYDGIKYKEPKYYHTIKLRVYTGGNYKVYSGVIGYNGVASIKIPNLSIGNHHVEVYYDNSLKGSSTIKIIKSTTKVYAPTKTIKHDKNTYYKIKVLDSHGNPVKKIVLKVNVFTDKKSKTYSIKTDNKGVAKLKTIALALGKHKVTIKTHNKKYKISKTTKIIMKKNVPKKAEKLSVSAPSSTVKCNQNHYYQISVKNSYVDPVKNLVLNVKVTTDKKSKTYSIKTNSKGIAKLQTKKLTLGTHKISISTNNKNYNVQKPSKIIVKKDIVPKSGEPTKLKSLIYSPTDNDYHVKLTWISKSGTSYQVLKKTTGNYEVLSTVKANSSETSYQDKVSKGVKATYSVRELIQTDNRNIIGAHDNNGLTLIDSPNVNVDFQNLKAKIMWSKINEATQYRIYRKVGRDGTFKCIDIVDGKQTSYVDWYYKSYDELKDILRSEKFVDPSYNNLFYTVRACNIQEVDEFQKVSYGLYLKDGDFNLESPSIISLKDNEITWSTVTNAEGYLILKRAGNSTVWEEIAQTGASSSTKKSKKIGEIDNTSYYAVQAFATKNGVKVLSNFDKGFTLKYYSQKNSEYRVLFIGDSITFGSPYKSKSTIHVFSMPYMISQLTGCVYYNPSIPSSTYHLGDYNRYRITRDIVDPISVGELPSNSYILDSAKNSEGETNTKISDYNVVVLLGGTNDYLDNTVLGSIDDTSTYTFNGALNHIMNKIKEASDYRKSNNQTPIKLVFVDLFYSDRTHTFTEHNNRDITPNKIGLTLMDYQNALDKQLKKWSGSFETFNFNTRDYGIVTSKNCPYTTSDNLHFSKFTYGQYGNAMAEFFAKYVFT